jgi:hypothetical protein
MLGLRHKEPAQVRRADRLQAEHTLLAQKRNAAAHVALVSLAGQVRQTALDTAVIDEV